MTLWRKQMWKKRPKKYLLNFCFPWSLHCKAKILYFALKKLKDSLIDLFYLRDSLVDLVYLRDSLIFLVYLKQCVAFKDELCICLKWSFVPNMFTDIKYLRFSQHFKVILINLCIYLKGKLSLKTRFVNYLVYICS